MRLIGLLRISGGAAPPVPWSPADKAGAIIGLDALAPAQFGSPANNGSVTSWTDSVSGVVFAAGTAGTYEVDSGDGYPGVRCPANLGNTVSEIINTGTPFSIYVVYRQIDWTADIYAGIFTFKTSSEIDSPYIGFYDGKFGFNSTGTVFKSWKTTAADPATGTTNYSIMTYNGAGPTDINNYAYYLNGVQEAIASFPFAPSYNDNRIGSYANDGSFGFDGYVKEIWVFTSAMTEEDLANFAAYVARWGL